MSASRLLTPVARILLFLQAALILTGGAVRLTGSGLGCPTWPECTYDSIAPEAGQVEGAFHAWIEFGNRLITVFVTLIALAMIIIVKKAKRRDLTLLALSQIGGVFAQIILGGITVLTHLNPIAVAAHFMPSIILIAAAQSLVTRSYRPRIEPVRSPLIYFHTALTFIVIAAGTLVTGAGPHSGDADSPRLDIPIATLAARHGYLVVELLLFTLLAIYWKFPGRNAEMQRRLIIFLGVTIAQGLVGLFQYFNGVPALLVALHLLGTSLLWIAAWQVRLTMFYDFSQTLRREKSK